MNTKESIQQIETLIEAWQLDEADLNQTDINAMQALLKENQELKKQLEDMTDCRDIASGHRKEVQDRETILLNQQKEFIKYLEDEINKTDYEINILGNYPYLAWSNACKKNLQKYKSIIGDKQ